MDAGTREFYERDAERLASVYAGEGASVWFDEAFPKETCRTILDVGCGTGRDLVHLLAAGYDA